MVKFTQSKTGQDYTLTQDYFIEKIGKSNLP